MNRLASEFRQQRTLLAPNEHLGDAVALGGDEAGIRLPHFLADVAGLT